MKEYESEGRRKEITKGANGTQGESQRERETELQDEKMVEEEQKGGRPREGNEKWTEKKRGW